MQRPPWNPTKSLGKVAVGWYASYDIHPMPKKTRISISLILAAISSVSVADETTKPGAADDSMTSVLKTELFALAEKLGDTSEAGEDHAAQLLAAARRIQTE